MEKLFSTEVTSQHRVSFQVLGEFKPINNFSLENLGSVVLSTNPDDSNMKILAVVCFHYKETCLNKQIKYRAGSKVLTLRSNIEIVNETEINMEIKFQLELTNEEKIVILVPKERLSVPIAFAAHGSVQVRPSQGFQWSQVVHCGNLKAGTGGKRLGKSAE